jgi:putative transposase
MSIEKHLRKATYRLYPTPKQVVALEALLRSHQQLYNAALEERIDCYRKTGQSLSYADQCKSLTVLRTELPEWAAAANCSSQQMTLRRLDKAFSAFFRRVKAGQTPGFPRFKSLARMPGFSFKSHGDGWRFTPNVTPNVAPNVAPSVSEPDAEGATRWTQHGSLRISGVGQLRARGQARQGGEIRSSDLLFRDGRWYLSLTIDIGRPERERTGEAALAFDWGVETFLSGVTHTGHTGEVLRIDNTRWYQADKAEITALQQVVSRKRNKRSNRRRKAVRILAAAKGKTARRRLDWSHKLAAQLAARFALVATEELTVANLTRSAAGTVDEPGKNVAQKAGLNREILDTAPALFTSLLRCKVLETGGDWVDAPTRKLKPSQRCPACWAVAKKALSQRVHLCAVCGHTEPRDVASARVVLRWALEADQKETGREPRLDGGDCRPRETPSFAQA